MKSGRQPSFDQRIGMHLEGGTVKQHVEQFLDIGAVQLPEQLWRQRRGRTVVDDLATVQRHGAGAILDGEFDLVQGHDDGATPLAVHFRQQFHHVAGGFRIERGDRLVGEHDPGFLHQAAGQRGALLLAAGQGDDIYEVRQVVEALIVAKLARDPVRLAGSGLADLLAKAEKLAAKGDFAQCHTLNIEFHDRLAVLTGNAALLEHYRRLVNAIALFRHQAHSKIRDASSLKASVADHQAILNALLNGDAKAAAHLLRDHVEASRARLQQLLIDPPGRHP